MWPRRSLGSNKQELWELAACRRMVPVCCNDLSGWLREEHPDPEGVSASCVVHGVSEVFGRLAPGQLLLLPVSVLSSVSQLVPVLSCTFVM